MLMMILIFTLKKFLEGNNTMNANELLNAAKKVPAIYVSVVVNSDIQTYMKITKEEFKYQYRELFSKCEPDTYFEADIHKADGCLYIG